MKNNCSTNAFILYTDIKEENDLNLIIFTENFGKIKCLAKNALLSRQRFSDNLKIPNLIRAYFSKNNLFFLQRIDLLDDFKKIKTTYADYNRIYKICNIILELTSYNEVNIFIFKLINEALNLIKKGIDFELVYLKFYLKLFENTGWINLDFKCAKCANRAEIFFDYYNKEWVCSRCLDPYKQEKFIKLEKNDLIFLKELLDKSLTEKNKYGIEKQQKQIIIKKLGYIKKLIIE